GNVEYLPERRSDVGRSAPAERRHHRSHVTANPKRSDVEAPPGFGGDGERVRERRCVQGTPGLILLTIDGGRERVPQDGIVPLQTIEDGQRRRHRRFDVVAGPCWTERARGERSDDPLLPSHVERGDV